MTATHPDASEAVVATVAPYVGACPTEAPTLTGDRIALRAIRPADVNDIVDISVYDGVVASCTAEARAMLQRIVADAVRGDTVHWGITRTGSDTVVGTIGFYRGFADGTGEVGYVLRAPFRRQGLMREALGLVVAFGFRRLGLTRIVARTDPANDASIALLGSIGFEPLPSDGVTQEFGLRDGRRAVAAPPSD